MPQASFIPTSQVGHDFGGRSDDGLEQRPAKRLRMEDENALGLQDEAFETREEYSGPNSPAPMIDLDQYEDVGLEGDDHDAIQVRIVIFFRINIIIL